MNHAKQQSIEEPTCSRTSPPSTSNEVSDYNFHEESTISEEVNNSNEELIEEDVVCWNCLNLEKENRRLKNRIVTLEEQVSKWKTESRRYRRQGKKGFTVTTMGMTGLHNSYPSVLASLEFGSNEYIF